MTVTTRALPLVLALFSVSVLDACKKAPPPPPAPAVDSAAIRAAREDSIRMENQRRAAAADEARRRAAQDSIDRANAAAEAARRDSEMLRSTVAAVINFDFDKSDLRDDAKANLDAKIPILLANSNVTIRVSGHADERGSSEYNLALGQRRAAAAKRYLVERGVAESRVETTSFGEERPVCTESNESCWAQNRRDEFEITAGGPLTRPR
ncbi:MAG TPA: peptidoglycan-associated lipoprotein Pal [Gemmatimonadaceae bacterium]